MLLNELTEISGQKAIATISKKDVASFQVKKRNAYWSKSNSERGKNV